MANYRTGPARGITNRPGTLPWREDTVILARIFAGDDLRQQGKRQYEIAAALGVSIDAVREDRKHLIELYRDQAGDRIGEHIANLRSLQQKCYALLDSTDNRSLNKTALLARIESVEMAIAKLDGSLVERVEAEVGPVTFSLDIPRLEHA